MKKGEGQIARQLHVRVSTIWPIWRVVCVCGEGIKWANIYGFVLAALECDYTIEKNLSNWTIKLYTIEYVWSIDAMNCGYTVRCAC